ncbi:hypothetical protein ABKW28_12785 [Nocardioides sp. 31GB23]|uniref:Uncharacterized protein n=1 Tax=Nocardioides salarius TaxID=374513 RepID=A0ABS2MCI6_9ACTN|nr:hypothetical protein [Nocardioides salarius]MBM7508917.1 hypothetical protein [Nocardioides salarius]
MTTTAPPTTAPPLTCRLLDHRHRFRSEGAVMTWACERGCGAGGSKEYASARAAAHYAAAFDRPASGDLGRKAPLLGMFPLRVWRWLRQRREGVAATGVAR